MQFRLQHVPQTSVLALVLLAGITGPMRAGVNDSSPGFQIRTPNPEVSARTLDWVDSKTSDDPEPKIWIYFTDKQIFDSETCAARLADVRTGLDERSIIRRAKTMGGNLVDFLDIPVSEEYVETVAETGAEIVHRSRWLNAVSVRASIDELRAIAGLPFIHKITLVRGHHSPRVRPETPLPDGDGPMGDRNRFDYGPSYAQLDEIGVIAAHIAGYSGSGVLVAVFDTGFKRDHPAFEQIVNEGRIFAEWDVVNNDNDTMDGPLDLPGTQDHGSATWSVLGGFYEGELIGPAYGATFVLAKTEDVADEYPEEEDNWVAAAEWADMLGVDIISSSLAYSRWYTVEDMDGDTAVTTIGADIAASRGILVVNGAGNMGDQDWYIVTAPADGDSIVAVGAVDANNDLAGFSSHGPTADGRTKPEVVARGLGVVCACNFTHDPLDDEFATNSGTSLSCPLVAGAAALLIEAVPSWPPMLVRETLMMTADNADTPDNDRGWGRIDVSAAIDVALTSDAPTVTQQAFDARLKVIPNPVRTATRFVMELPASVRPDDSVHFDIFDIDGRRVWSSDLQGNASVVDWECDERVPAGIYLARLRAGAWQATAKVVVDR